MFAARKSGQASSDSVDFKLIKPRQLGQYLDPIKGEFKYAIICDISMQAYIHIQCNHIKVTLTLVWYL